ncbi:MAG: MBL fold metallo-hydrolase [Flavobacteriaceae bacterium]|nr:MBL fold metallo-hydrolase [Flavobacteriaceae bacterium]MCY4160744.1 MBL fold metallo-hydrolase [Flavobacteriaceae bacterium]MCY4253735.1 MBL fold metallo-hydrolase [Flavobacteriaceae bacterium]MCY4299892.1 MBL fold metallo-hydrolase [Flavobacteriaceae bacterium]
MLEITFLGTGTSYGAPVVTSDHEVCFSEDRRDNRLRSSILIQWNDCHLIIDCGPDFRQQCLRSKLQRLDALLFTHEHADHTAGLDDIRAFNFKQGPIPIFLSKRVLKSLKKRYHYVFDKRITYKGRPEVTPNIIKDLVPFQLKGKQILPIEVNHTVVPVLGFRIDDFAYITDIKSIKPEKIKYLKNLQLLVLGCIRKEPHPNHLNVDEALALIKEIQPKQCYFTHISNLIGFHETVSKELPQNVFLGYDQLKLTI